jgi:hypothetical protein
MQNGYILYIFSTGLYKVIDPLSKIKLIKMDNIVIMGHTGHIMI